MCNLKAVDIYIEMSRFTLAAKHLQIVAEILEENPAKQQEAIKHYEHAHFFFKREGSIASANNCLKKAGLIASQLEDYEKAIAIYEDLALTVFGSCVLKVAANEYLFRGALCHLCIDAMQAQRALERYLKLYPDFKQSRDYKLVKNLIFQVKIQNVDGFVDAVTVYDAASRLEPWYSKILFRIKQKLVESITSP